MAISSATVPAGSLRAPASAASCRDRRRERDVQLRQPSAGGVRGEGHMDHGGVADVDVGVVVRDVCGVGDRSREVPCVAERRGTGTTPRAARGARASRRGRGRGSRRRSGLRARRASPHVTDRTRHPTGPAPQVPSSRRTGTYAQPGGDEPSTQASGSPPPTASDAARRPRPQRRPVDRAQSGVGWLRLLRRSHDAAATRLRARRLARRPVHARQRRARLPFVQRQQVQRRSHGVAAAATVRRGGVPAAPPRDPHLTGAHRTRGGPDQWPAACAYERGSSGDQGPTRECPGCDVALSVRPCVRGAPR